MYSIVSKCFVAEPLPLITILFFNITCAQRGVNKLGKKDTECVAKLGNIHTRHVESREFKAQERGAGFIRISHCHWEPVSVNRFSLMVLRDTPIVFRYNNRGGKFDNALKSGFQKIQSHDSVLFFDIYAKLADGKEAILNPLEFKIEYHLFPQPPAFFLASNTVFFSLN